MSTNLAIQAIHIPSNYPPSTYLAFIVERPDGRFYSVQQTPSSDVKLLRHWVATCMFLVDSQVTLVYQGRTLTSGTIGENGIITGCKLHVLPVVASGGLIPRRRGLSIVVFGILGNEYLPMSEGETSVKRIVERMSDDFVVEFIEGNCCLVVQLKSTTRHLELKVRLEPPMLTSAELAAELEEECTDDTQLPLALRKGPVVETISFRSSNRLSRACTGYLLPSVVAGAKDAHNLMQIILRDILYAVPKRALPRHMTLDKPSPITVPELAGARQAKPDEMLLPELQQQLEPELQHQLKPGAREQPNDMGEGGRLAAEPTAPASNTDDDNGSTTIDNHAATQNEITRGKIRSLLQRMSERHRQHRRDGLAPYGSRPSEAGLGSR